MTTTKFAILSALLTASGLLAFHGGAFLAGYGYGKAVVRSQLESACVATPGSFAVAYWDRYGDAACDIWPGSAMASAIEVQP